MDDHLSEKDVELAEAGKAETNYYTQETISDRGTNNCEQGGDINTIY